MVKVKVGIPYVPERKWNGKYLIISSYKPDPREVEWYQAKRTYYVHAIYKHDSVFLGRFFELKRAREKVLSY